MIEKFFGDYGGQYVAETLTQPLIDLEKAYIKVLNDNNFWNKYKKTLKDYCGRPTSLYYAENISKELGCDVYLKREDLNHTGAHKINNTIGQIFIALEMGKNKIIAETGAGQHGVATATVCAKYGLKCDIYMGEEDIKKQNENVKKIKLLGANIIPVSYGKGTLKEATSEAIRGWIKEADTAYYLIGSVVGPSPYPQIVRNFQRIIGDEVKKQLNEMGLKPTMLIACIGGGSNSLGLFYPFLEDKEIKCIGVEAYGKELKNFNHAATLLKGSKGIIHGMKTIVLQDRFGQIDEVYSISSGLDYPGVGPEHANLYDLKKVEYIGVDDLEAIKAFEKLSKLEGIIPAFESAHALAGLYKIKDKIDKNDCIVVNISGRGDKDISTYYKTKEENIG